MGNRASIMKAVIAILFIVATVAYGAPHVTSVEDYFPDTLIAVPSNDKCSVCKSAMKGIRMILDNKALGDLMDKGINAACTTTGPFKPICTAGLKAILSLIKKEIKKKDDTKICILLKLCKETGAVPSNDKCDICISAMKGVKYILSSDNFRTVVKEGIALLCEKASFLQAICESGLDELVDTIFDKAAKMDERHLCELIWMCPKSMHY